LTAFVVKSFYQARSYIDIDMDNVARATNWMIEQQMENGQFDEPGRVIHTDMQVKETFIYFL
jgi:CD109 antigen